MQINAQQIQDAHERIRPYIHRTPVFTSHSLDLVSGAQLFFKPENLQKTGSFKIRGALNAVLSLPEQARQRGVATHSSGNHAQAIAYASKIAGMKAFIVMPDNSPKVKVNAVRGYGAEIFFCEPTLQARENKLSEVLEKTGTEFIHPYNNYDVITGQATCAKELFEDMGLLDAVITPVGGGGLLSGTCLSTFYYSPDTAVYAGEPEGAADAVLSFKTGKIEKAPFINTIADGLLTTLGNKTLPIISHYARDILLVSDEEIIAAMRLVYERMKLVIEPSGAVPLAAVLKNKKLFEGQRVGVIFSGGNVDLGKLGEWFA